MVADEPFDHRISFLNSNGGEAAPPEVILPFGFYCPDSDTFHPHATGFYFSWEGLICSAKHAFEFDKRFRAQMSHLSDRSYLVAYQIMPDRKFVYRRIMAAHAHPKYDLAVAILEPIRNFQTRERFENLVLAMTLDQFEIGTDVHQYSYPDPFLVPQDDAGYQTCLIPLLTRGKIIDCFPDGMGSIFPSPTYVIEGYIGAGSSGGPIMDDTGRVFAICSRANAECDYYYGIPVREIADIKIDSIVLGTPPIVYGPTVRQMAARQMISFVKPAAE